ncbi:MAG TPA: nitrogen regulation protein NR(II) [Burkholderiales bacterium]|jgi:two-component system, NtrC family, nitrogen regulation sensor histidine kinase GlnL|nr:nitrogen regulation protein NR(II) [Burkholderiales bacterium]
MNAHSFNGLELLATAVLVLDDELRVRYANPAVESVLQSASRNMLGQSITDLFVNAQSLCEKLRQALDSNRGFWDQFVLLNWHGHEPIPFNVLVTPIETPPGLLVELRSIDQQVRIEREAHFLEQHQANRELIRNLAHEIKNPLGGLRGSAQLLEGELDRPDLREYTQVIIKEADRLQVLMDRLLTPHRPPHMGPVNIHEVCERVRSLILAEFPQGITFWRDYDTSLPDIHGDREQLIQVVLNIVRNAAQALRGRSEGKIQLRTRVARSVTIARRMHRLALELQVIDNGPGIPAELLDRVFYPLVSGREGGTGLGLTLAQTYVQHHHGLIECQSEPGRTVFRIVLPLDQIRA